MMMVVHFGLNAKQLVGGIAGSPISFSVDLLGVHGHSLLHTINNRRIKVTLKTNNKRPSHS
jgi:hypothetical protein